MKGEHLESTIVSTDSDQRFKSSHWRNMNPVECKNIHLEVYDQFKRMHNLVFMASIFSVCGHPDIFSRDYCPSRKCRIKISRLFFFHKSLFPPIITKKRK